MPSSSGAAALRLATLGGAEAVGLGEEIGSLRAGKRADVVLLDTTGPAWTPPGGDPAVQLVFGSDGRAVRHVVASGRVVVRDGTCTTVDHRALAPEASAARRRLLAEAEVATGVPSREQCTP